MAGSSSSASKGAQFLWALLSAVCGAIGYLLVELIMGHDISSVLWGMLGIVVVVTPLLFFVNLWRAGRTTAEATSHASRR